MDLHDRVAVVTGGAQGLGRADALLLAREGASIAVLDLNEAKANEVAAEIIEAGGKAVAVAADVAKFDQVQSAMETVRRTLGPIGILVNNAALLNNFSTFSKITHASWEKELSITLTGPFNCTKAVWDEMTERKYGRIVNVSSIAALMGGFGQVSYASAKAAIIGMTKTLALEGARHNIRANCVAPSLAQTPSSEVLDEQTQERILKRFALRRLAEPNEIAETVVFLASDRSSYITGQVISVMGGADLFVF